MFEKLAADSPAELEYQSQLAGCHDNLASLLVDIDRLGEAEQQYHRAVVLLEKLVDATPSVPRYRSDLARHYLHLGNRLYRRGERPEAEKAYGRALALQEKLAADSPAVPEYRGDLALILNGLGAVWMIHRPTDSRRLSVEQSSFRKSSSPTRRPWSTTRVISSRATATWAKS